MTRVLRWPALAPYCLWIIVVTVLALPWLLSVWVEEKIRNGQPTIAVGLIDWLLIKLRLQ